MNRELLGFPNVVSYAVKDDEFQPALRGRRLRAREHLCHLVQSVRRPQVRLEIV